MFISDFAIKRPVITVVSMVALVVFGLVSLVLLQTDEFPDVAVPLVVVSVPYPGASPDSVEREIVGPSRKRSPASAASRSHVELARQLRRRDGRVHVREGPAGSDAGDSRRDQRDPQRPAGRDERARPHEVNPTDFPIISLALASKKMSVPQLTLLADPGSLAGCGRSAGSVKSKSRVRTHAG